MISTMGFSKIAIAAVATALSLLFVAEAQSSMGCITPLSVCAPFMNATTPSRDCCTALQDVIAHQLPCLCTIYNNPAILGSININITQAITLPARCGIHTGVSACFAPPPASPPVSLPPRLRPGLTPPPGNGIGKASLWIGIRASIVVMVLALFY